jgi:integrase
LVRRSFKPLLVRAGLLAIRFHDLRHAAATLHFALGTDVKTTQEILGHSRVSTTLDIYAPSVPALHADVVLKLDALLTG